MKYMTIEEKAMAYDEALEKIRPLYEQAKKDDNPVWSTYEYLFPQIQESEDERMARVIGLALTDVPEERFASLGVNLKDCLGYLEKKKEQGHDGKKWIYEDDYRKDMDRSFNDGRDEVLENPEKYGLQKEGEWSFPYGKDETVDKLMAIAECLEMDGDCLFNGYKGTECGKILRDLARKQTEGETPEWSEDDKCISPKEGDIVVNRYGEISVFESWGHHPDGGSFNDKSYFFAKCTLDGDWFEDCDCHPDSVGLRYATQEEIRRIMPYLLKEKV